MSKKDTKTKILFIEKSIRLKKRAFIWLIPNSIKILKKIIKNKNTQINSSIINEYPPNILKKKELIARLKTGNEINLRSSYLSEKPGLKFKSEKAFING